MNQIFATMVLRVLFVALVTGSVGGCSYIIKPTSFQANAQFNQPAKKKVALVLSNEIRNYIHKGSPNSMTGSLQSYEFRLGNVISDALEASFKSAFHDVEVLSYPPNDTSSYDAIIRPKVASFEFAINDSGALVNSFLFGALGAAATSYSSDVMIRIEAEVRMPPQFNARNIVAEGYGRKGAGTFSWKGSDFNESSGRAVSEAVNRLVTKIAYAVGELR